MNGLIGSKEMVCNEPNQLVKGELPFLLHADPS